VKAITTAALRKTLLLATRFGLGIGTLQLSGSLRVNDALYPSTNPVA